jgi:hypothetical protein
MAGDIGEAAGGWHGAEPGEAAGGRQGEPAAAPAPGQSAESAGEVPVTGEPRVDAALARLDELDGLPVTEHTRVFDDVHRRLEDVLGELGTGAAGPGR